MIRLLENYRLTTDLDCGGKRVRHQAPTLPVPAAFVDINDTRMSNARAPLAGSVVNASLAWNAAISQSKLNLNSTIPSIWLTVSGEAGKAPKGSAAEFLSHKNAVSGYVGLDGSGKSATGQLPSTGPQAGTVTVVNMTSVLAVSPSSITTSGTLAATWKPSAGNTILGNTSGSPAAPLFASVLPDTLVPSLDGSILTTGTLSLSRLPLAIGLGGSHAVGMTPDTGLYVGDATDYLARDMSWQSMVTTPPAYQPKVPNPVITFQYFQYGQAYMQISSPLSKAFVFYRNTDPGGSRSSTFTPTDNNSVIIAANYGALIEAYSAKAGYSRSSISYLIVPTP